MSIYADILQEVAKMIAKEKVKCEALHAARTCADIELKASESSSSESGDDTVAPVRAELTAKAPVADVVAVVCAKRRKRSSIVPVDQCPGCWAVSTKRGGYVHSWTPPCLRKKRESVASGSD